jgi:hypothetical protein
LPGSMRRPGTIGIIVSVVLIIALLIVFTDPWSTLRRDSRHIVLEDPSAIDRISLADAFDSTLLVRKDTAWLLFGSEPVNPVAVANLLFAAGRIQINSILTGPPDLEGKTICRVRFFKGDRPVLQYAFISDGKQFLIRPLGSERAYYVSLSGYGGLDLGRVFSSAANHYREHTLIDLLPSEISLIEVDLRGSEPYRFEQDTRGDIRCLLPERDSIIPPGRLNELSIRLLFSYFTDIRYERRSGIPVSRLTGPGAESPPLARLLVVSREGEKYLLLVFPYYGEGGKQADMFRALVAYNDRPEALIVNYIYLDVLMRELSRYFAGGE